MSEQQQPADRTEVHQPSNPLDAAMAAAFAPSSGPPAPGSVLRALGADLPRVQLRQAEGEGLVVRPDSPEMPSGLGERYQLHGEIARGGMGAVLLGRDTDLGRDVAVKVLLEAHAGQTELLQRFVEEAQIAGQLQHPGVVPVYELGRFPDKRPYFAMKLVKGDTLAKLLARRKALDEERTRWLGVFLQVCQALAYAHARGVIHRDLKPSNVMVGGFGEVQVMDWGLAKVLSRGGVADESAARQSGEGLTAIRTRRSEGSSLPGEGTETQAGSVMGTFAYMPPEQALGEVERLDERADVFALGSMLCEVLTGLPAYAGEDSAQVHRKAVRADLADAFARLDGSGADGELLTLCKRCLSAEPGDRPRDAAEVAEGVSAYLQGVEQRLKDAELQRGRAEVRAVEERKRRRVQLALGLALAVLLLGGVAFGWWQGEQGRVARERLARNTEAVIGLLEQCQQALRKGDAAGAAVTLEAAQKRAEEGSDEEQADSLERCAEDLAVLRDLDAVDQFRWTPAESKLPNIVEVAARFREALGRFGADPDKAGVEQAAARVSGSMVRQRLVAALDRMLRAQHSVAVRAALRAVDPDPFRDAVRDAVWANDRAAAAKLAARVEALRQPPGFAAFLGESGAIGIKRRRELLRAAVQRRPADLGLLMALGNTYPDKHEEVADERLRWFQAAVGVAPFNPAAHNNLGVALADKKDRRGAIAAYREAVRLDPRFAFAHNNLGLALARMGDLKGAIAELKEAVRLKPTLALAHNNLGVALRDNKDLKGAISEYEEAIRLKPTLAMAHYNLGVALADKKDLKGAIAEYKEAIRLDSTLALAHNDLGLALARRGDLKGAIAELKEAVRLDPKNAMAHNGLGVALSDKKDMEGAIAEYKEAIRLDPRYASPHTNLGNALYVKGDLEGAIAEYKEAIRLDPNIAIAHNNLGAALADKKDMEGAIAELKEAIRLDPKDARPHLGLGLALQAKGDLEGAVTEYKKAIRLDPRNAFALANLPRAERMRVLLPRLADVLAGKQKPKSPTEACEFADLCAQPFQKRYAAAVRLFADAFAADPKLAEDLTAAHRYNAACYAARAARGDGIGAPAGATDHSALRGKALAWLRADLALRHKQAASAKAAQRQTAASKLSWWQKDADLAGIRDKDALAKLPAEERSACEKLWADVQAARVLALKGPPATPKQ